MNRNKGTKSTGRKGVAGTFIALLLIGALAIAVPVIMQDMQLTHDAAEYDTLRDQLTAANTKPSVDETSAAEPEQPISVEIPDEDEPQEITPTSQMQTIPATQSPQTVETPAADSSAAPSQAAERKPHADLAALKAQNSDFIAWIEIPGTNVDYPVVLTDDPDYYLTHTFSGSESKIGTLFSLGKTDYETPGRNIAIYGHNIASSSQKMFRTLHEYKDSAFYDDHATVYLDTLYHSGEYTIFAVLNMKEGEWEPSTSVFMDDQAFMDFVSRAKAKAMYDTDVKVSASDEIITLITCDRRYSDPDGRLLVMAVKQ